MSVTTVEGQGPRACTVCESPSELLLVLALAVAAVTVPAASALDCVVLDACAGTSGNLPSIVVASSMLARWPIVSARANLHAP